MDFYYLNFVLNYHWFKCNRGAYGSGNQGRTHNSSYTGWDKLWYVIDPIEHNLIQSMSWYLCIHMAIMTWFLLVQRPSARRYSVHDPKVISLNPSWVELRMCILSESDLKGKYTVKITRFIYTVQLHYNAFRYRLGSQCSSLMPQMH